MTTGIVETLHIVRARRGVPEPLGEAALVPGRGLPGDHHDRAGVKRAITLIRAESLDDLARALGLSFAAGASRRNLAVRGLDLDRLPKGARLRLGTGLVEVRGPCEPCDRLETSLGKGALARLQDRGGIYVRVLQGGFVRPGDAVTLLEGGHAVPPSPPTPLQRALLGWFRASNRDLPWRRTRDPYAVWVSEVMLQQTQVATAIPFFERFVQRFPTVQSLAAAPLDDVLAHWSGLGYYARARNLHRASQAVVDQHAGLLPRDLAALRELPGFGPYTAGAVASIALGMDAALVDGNVARVLCRLEGWEVGAEEALVRAWAAAPGLLPAGDAGDFNQALMELGATVCTPATPRCDGCPVRSGCASARRGDPARFPLPKVRRPRTKLRFAALAVREDGRILLVRRAQKGLFGGLWDLPGVVLDDGQAAREAVRTLARQLLGAKATVEHVGSAAQALTHRDVEVEVFEAHGGTLKLPDDARLVLPEEIGSLGLSTLAAKVLEVARVALPPGHGRRRATNPAQRRLF